VIEIFWNSPEKQEALLYAEFLTHLGPRKPQKLSHRFGRILMTALGGVEATARRQLLRPSEGPFRTRDLQRASRAGRRRPRRPVS
jgi:hypothetical protein